MLIKTSQVALIAALALAAPAYAADSAAAQETAPSEEQLQKERDAIAAATEAGTLYQQQNFAEVVSTAKPHLPTIRMIAERDSNMGWLASVMSQIAYSELSLGNQAAASAMLQEIAGLWRTELQSNPNDANIRNSLTTTLLDMARIRLNAGDKVGATPLLDEIIALAGPAYDADPSDAANANNLLAANIFMTQVAEDFQPYLERAKTLGQTLRDNGTLNAANKPNVDAILASG